MPNIVYSVAERVEMVRQHEQGISYRHIVDHFAAENPGRPIPSVSTVRNIVTKFHKTGNLDLSLVKISQPSRQLSEEIRFNICLKAEEDPNKSISKIAKELHISKSSVRNVLRSTKLRSYNSPKQRDDDESQTTFSPTMMNRLKADEGRLRRVCFSNESTILYVSKLNRQKVRMCSWRIQHRINLAKIKYQKLHVWTGVVNNTLIGPFFIEGSLNGEKYLQMLRQEVIPALRELDEDVIWYQRNGAAPYYTADVWAYLNQEFPGRSIGKDTPSQEPTSVLDMSLLDHALWGRLKNILYAGEKIENLSVLRTKVSQIVKSMDPQAVGNTIRAFYDRGLKSGDGAHS